MNDTTIKPLSDAQRRSNQIKLLILWLVPFGLMAIAGLCYYLVQNGYMTIGSKNHGVLIRPPVQLKELFSDAASAANTVEADNQTIWDGKWSLVIRGDAACNEDCREVLDFTQRIHIRLDKEANRLQRIYLTGAAGVGNKLNAFIRQEHHYLKLLSVDASALATLDEALVSEMNESASFFIVDPQGWAMMYYLPQHDGNGILQDLKHLLKYSRER